MIKIFVVGISLALFSYVLIQLLYFEELKLLKNEESLIEKKNQEYLKNTKLIVILVAIYIVASSLINFTPQILVLILLINIILSGLLYVQKNYVKKLFKALEGNKIIKFIYKLNYIYIILGLPIKNVLLFYLYQQTREVANDDKLDIINTQIEFLININGLILSFFLIINTIIVIKIYDEIKKMSRK